VFHQRVKGQLNGNARVKDHHLAAGPEHVEARMRAQKLPHRLSPRLANDGQFVLQGIVQGRVAGDELNFRVHHHLLSVNAIEVRIPDFAVI